MRNVGELLEIENSAQFVLKGLSQLLLQPPARARKRPYRHMGSLCKMTTVVAVVFAALVGLFPGFFKEGVGGETTMLCRWRTGRTWAKLSSDLVGSSPCCKVSWEALHVRRAARAPRRIVNPISERHYIVVPDVPYIAMTRGRHGSQSVNGMYTHFGV